MFFLPFHLTAKEIPKGQLSQFGRAQFSTERIREKEGESLMSLRWLAIKKIKQNKETL